MFKLQKLSTLSMSAINNVKSVIVCKKLESAQKKEKSACANAENIAIVAAIASIIFWVQSADDGRIQHIEDEVKELKADMKEINKQNSEILRLIGRIEGAMTK